jgi:hypothetical protein
MVVSSSALALSDIGFIFPPPFLGGRNKVGLVPSAILLRY